MKRVTIVAAAALLIAACGGGTTPGPSTPAPTIDLTASPSQPTAPPASPTDQPTTSPTASPIGGPSGTPPASPTDQPTDDPTDPPPSDTPPPDAFVWARVTDAAEPGAREDHTFTLGGDGASAFLYGGRRGDRAFDDIWRYDLTTDTWQQLSPEGDIPPARFGHVAAWVDAVGLVVWSGQADADTFFGDIWAFDPESVAWTRLPDGGDVPLARYGSCGAVGPDGRLWISHGFTDDEGRFSDTKAYDFASGTWSDHTIQDGDVPVLRCLHDCLWTPDGQLVLYAGQTTGAPAIGDLWTRDGSDAGWTQQPQPPAPPRQLYALGVLGDRAFIFGGGDSNGQPLNDLWLLDLATFAWAESTPDGGTPAARSGATLVADPARGRLLLFGGRGGEGELADMWMLTAEPFTR